MGAPRTCPNCGADVPPHARACPECGSDEQTGWSEEAATSGLDLPNQEFDYDRFVKEEFGQESKSPVPSGLHWLWWIVAILVLLALLKFLVF